MKEIHFNFAKANNLNLSTKIDKRPNLERLRELGQISKAEQLLMDYLRLLGFRVVQQVLFPSLSLKTNKPITVPVDAVVTGGKSNKSIIVELDGTVWHDAEKDNHRDEIMTNLGIKTLRLPYSKPSYPKDSLQHQNWWNNYLQEAGEKVKNNLG